MALHDTYVRRLMAYGMAGLRWACACVSNALCAFCCCMRAARVMACGLGLRWASGAEWSCLPPACGCPRCCLLDAIAAAASAAAAVPAGSELRFTPGADIVCALDLSVDRGGNTYLTRGAQDSPHVAQAVWAFVDRDTLVDPR